MPCEKAGPGEDVPFPDKYRGQVVAANAAIARLSFQLGFRDHPDGFTVDEYELDKDHWCEGFVQR